MRIVYYEEDDILFVEFSKGAILRDESVSWNVNIGYTADGIGEITILECAQWAIHFAPVGTRCCGGSPSSRRRRRLPPNAAGV
jgi:hypothetical protein